MQSMDEFPPAVRLRGQHFVLVPRAVEHAAQMVDVLASSALYEHTGGSPPSLAELTRRYERQVAGSPKADEAWRNWVVRDNGRAVGYVQATVRLQSGKSEAEVAWVVRPDDQGRGVATDAATAMVLHLLAHGVVKVTASIADANESSRSVARRLGMSRTNLRQDGEQVWLLNIP